MTASVSIDPAVRREVQSDYFRYLLPTLIGQIAHSFYCMADVFFVGAAVGSDGLAALNVALPVFTLFSAFSLMVGVGTATTASILTGQGQTQQTNRVFTQSMVLLAVVGLTLTLLTSVFIVPLARVFGATDRILTEVVDYMRPINLLAFAYIFSGALGVIIRADGNPRLVMIARHHRQYLQYRAGLCLYHEAGHGHVRRRSGNHPRTLCGCAALPAPLCPAPEPPAPDPELL